MSEVVLAQHGDGYLNDQAVVGMYRLRHAVFHDRLGWDVTSDNGMEYDKFDKCNPVYILVRGDDNEIGGCWRLLPTTGPNMLRDVFPQLLHGKPIPAHTDVWELSRFALDTRENRNTNFGLSGIPLRMIQMAFQFARENSITRYVSVTSVAIERMFRKAGIHVTRLGEPIKIGRVLTVACAMEIDSITEFALFGTLPEDASRKVA